MAAVLVVASALNSVMVGERLAVVLVVPFAAAVAFCCCDSSLLRVLALEDTKAVGAIVGAFDPIDVTDEGLLFNVVHTNWFVVVFFK